MDVFVGRWHYFANQHGVWTLMKAYVINTVMRLKWNLMTDHVYPRSSFLDSEEMNITSYTTNQMFAILPI